jgi:hypothetical protein
MKSGRRLPAQTASSIFVTSSSFREQGFDLYDLGGYYPAKAPLHPELTRINEFKASFGGQLRHEANYLSAALHAYRVLSARARHLIGA